MKSGKLKTVDQFLESCMKHFDQGHPCLGILDKKTEEENEKYVVSQTPLPRKIAKGMILE